VVPLVDMMAETAFSARDLARAGRIFDQMVRDPDGGVILTLAGSIVSAGQKQVIVDLLRANMVDAIVSTGANVVDQDFFEALGFQPLPGRQVRERRHAARADDRPHLRHLHRRGAAAPLRRDRQADRRRPGARRLLQPRVPAGDGALPRRARPGRRQHRADRLRARRADLRAGLQRLLGGLRAGRPSGAAPRRARGDRLREGLPRAHRRQGPPGHHRHLHDRWRRAQELRPGHRGVGRVPRLPGRRDAQVRGAADRRRRARRRPVGLDPQGGELLGQGRPGVRADGVRRGDRHAAARGRLRVPQARLGRARPAPLRAIWDGEAPTAAARVQSAEPVGVSG
jgi:hypothetical protein